MPRHTTPHNLTLPTPLAELYASTAAIRHGTPSPLPSLSHLLAQAMRAELVQAGVDPSHPALAPPAPTRTSAATAARSLQRAEGAPPPRLPVRRKRSLPRCGLCGAKAHNRQTCPQREPTP